MMHGQTKIKYLVSFVVTEHDFSSTCWLHWFSVYSRTCAWHSLSF